MKNIKLFEEFFFEEESNFIEVSQWMQEIYEWDYVEQEGDNRIRFDWRQGQISFWLNSDMTGEGQLPSSIKRQVLDKGVNMMTNEGKLQRGLAKGAVNVAAFIMKFSRLFNKVGRKKLFKDMKDVNKMIDLISFMEDCESWLKNDKLSKDDIKTLADNLGITEKYPTEWNIFQAKYELEFKRKLKNDLDAIIEVLNEPYKGDDPKSLTYFKDVKEMAIALKSLIR